MLTVIELPQLWLVAKTLRVNLRQVTRQVYEVAFRNLQFYKLVQSSTSNVRIKYNKLKVNLKYFQKKSRNDGQSREDDNPFFAAGGPGTGTYENYDACIAQGEHELRYQINDIRITDVLDQK